MTSGLSTVIYPVKDLARAKALYAALLGEPAMDAPYYVGFQVGDQQLGLDPHGHDQGLTGPVGYWTVDDITGSSAGWSARAPQDCSRSGTSAAAS